MTNIHNEFHGYYENIEFNLTTGQSNYQLSTNQTTFLSNFGPTNVVSKYPTAVIIRTNNTISVALNSASNHAITITSTDSPFTIKGVEISDIFLSNSSGSTAAVKILVTSQEN